MMKNRIKQKIRDMKRIISNSRIIPRVIKMKSKISKNRTMQWVMHLLIKYHLFVAILMGVFTMVYLFFPATTWAAPPPLGMDADDIAYLKSVYRQIMNTCIQEGYERVSVRDVLDRYRAGALRTYVMHAMASSPNVPADVDNAVTNVTPFGRRYFTTVHEAIINYHNG